MSENNKEITLNPGFTDELTGLLNLNGILYELQNHEHFTASKKGSVIIFLNVMNFKAFNQRYGFAGGNVFLRAIASDIKSIFSAELMARTGGDQFVILSDSLTKKEILSRVKKVMRAAHKHEQGLNMRIKAGIYVANGDETDPVVMLDRAKIACDDISKVYDKDINIYDEELDRKNKLKQYVIDNFEKAFKKRYFKVYYQKEVRALTGKICGYEALARWEDPEMGLISPAIFVEVLESVHLVHKLDTYIIELVCEDLRGDIDSGFAVEPISVNLSQLDFELCDIKAEIDRCREKFGIPTELLHIEVTESAIAFGSDFLGEQIKRFRDAGYEVWMDDFGAGYSSFNNLKNYDFDVLKIDMNFLRSFDTNKKSRVILATIVNMAKELGIHTLAEGVETKEQYDFLRKIGCEKLQGYLFGKPKPLSEFKREIDCSYDTNEDFAFSRYYDRIGDINFLGNTPLRPKTMEVTNNVPLSILEYENGNLSFLYANSKYMELLSTLGVSSLDEADRRNQKAELQEVKELKTLLERAENAEDKRAEMDLVSNGSIINSKVRFIGETNGRKAYAIVTRNISMRNDKNVSESLHVAMNHVMNQYFRVDLYDEDGTVENVFLNGDQLPVADKENNAKKAVETYSNMYLYPEDRERFRKFYDISTVLDRCEEMNVEYIVDYYHSAIPGDRGRMQMYMILPFFYNDRWKFISCCRYADEMKLDVWK